MELGQVSELLVHLCRWSLSEQACPCLACKRGTDGTWKDRAWSCDISEDRGPVHLVRAKLTFGCAVAAANFSSVGREELEVESLLCLVSSKLLSQAPDRKFLHVTQPHLEETGGWYQPLLWDLRSPHEFNFHYPLMFPKLLNMSTVFLLFFFFTISCSLWTFFVFNFNCFF